MNERKDNIGLPKFVDWVVTFCEFVSIFAISASFFNLGDKDNGHTIPDYASDVPDKWNTAMPDIAADLTDKWLGVNYFTYCALLIVVASVIVVLVPYSANIWFGWSWSFLCHPKFAATIQIIKLVGAALNIYFLSTRYDTNGDREFTLDESNEKLTSSGILAGCELLIMLRTIKKGYYGEDSQIPTDMRNNPEGRGKEWFWVAINLWKDFGIVSSLIQTKELYFLIVEFPLPLLLSYFISHRGYDSHCLKYHLMRLLMVAWGAGTLYGSSKLYDSDFKLVDGMYVPLSLVTCEVIVALCEIFNGHANKKLKVTTDNTLHATSG